MTTATLTLATPAHVQPDVNAVKARQQAAWSTGDYAVIDATLLSVAESLCEAVDLHASQRVLDVPLVAATPPLAPDRHRLCACAARPCSAAEHLRAILQAGDAKEIRFPDASFDASRSVRSGRRPDQPTAALQP